MKVKFLETVNHNNADYGPGAEAEMTEAQAQALFDRGAAEPIKSDTESKGSTAKDESKATASNKASEPQNLKAVPKKPGDK
ncbi:hypothetical protein ACSCB1_35375 [Streptomyces europaeiscabiei]|uniref:DUF7210 family protein n=1 Tax=Streptomyces europaeiscabiei TaxID=146819 RepID=UPI000B331903|nr:hypothetical protein [Streptomyces europaeiscabiei]